MKSFHVWQFLAGIAVFVYAMSLIETSLKSLAGRSFKKFLQKHSQSKVKMLAASTVVTALLQSSSVVLLMVLSFVGAGLINMAGALAAVLGSNLGTTLSSWLIAVLGFKIDLAIISYPLLAISLLGLFLVKKKSRLYHATNFLIGFAFIFIGLGWLKSSADTSLENSLGNFRNWHYLFFVPIGFFITALIQSSSVTVAISLTALYNNLIPFENAAAVVIGSELGTTLKFLVGSIGGISDKKRVALGNFYLNLMTMILATLTLRPLVHLIKHVFRIEDELLGLVMFQSSINLFSIILFYPFLGVLARLLDRSFEGSQPNLTTYLKKRNEMLPEDALGFAEKETIQLMHETMDLNKKILGLEAEKKSGWFNNLRSYASESSSFDERYHRLKLHQGEILEYITEIPKDEMTEKELQQNGKLINITRHILRSTKNLKDIKHNLEDYKATANDRLFTTFSQVQERTKDFYTEFHSLSEGEVKVTVDAINNLTKKNRKQYDDALADILIALKDKKISELDSATLLNVYHEVYASNKALLRALADMKDLEAED